MHRVRPRGRRRTRTLLVTGLATATLAAGIVTPVLPTAPAAAVTAPLVPAVQLHLMQELDQAEVRRQLDLAKNVGAKVVRVTVGWGTLQLTSKATWDTAALGRVDYVVDQANLRGMKPLLTVVESPCWASSAPAALKDGCKPGWWNNGVQYYLPTNPSDYADVVEFLIKRYQARKATIAGWEIWNEPNLEDFSAGGDAADKARRYTALVKATYTRVNVLAGDVPIVAGALSEADYEFTGRLYDNGIKGYFDAFSIHPYNHDTSPLAQREPGYCEVSLICGVPAVRKKMTDWGDTRPMWLTEFGWSTNTYRNVNEPWFSGVSEADQATYVKQAVAKMATWDYVAVASYYDMVNDNDDPRSLLGNYGLTTLDKRVKPAYQAFKTATEALNPPTARSLVGKASGRCLAISGGSTSDSAPVVLWDCSTAATQKWRVDAGRVINNGSGKCLDVRGAGTANSTPVQQYTCSTGNPAQQWTIRADGTFYNPRSGKCLDVKGATVTNGSTLQIYLCGTTAKTNQVFTWR